MRLLGIVLCGLVVMAGESAAQSGTVFEYPGTGFSTFQDTQSGVYGQIYSYPGTGFQSYSDSTGRTGTIFTYPGTGMSTYQFSQPFSLPGESQRLSPPGVLPFGRSGFAPPPPPRLPTLPGFPTPSPSPW